MTMVQVRKPQFFSRHHGLHFYIYNFEAENGDSEVKMKMSRCQNLFDPAVVHPSNTWMFIGFLAWCYDFGTWGS